MQSALSSTCVPLQNSVVFDVLFLKNNGAKRDSHHIGIRRTVAEVPIRTEDVTRTSDAEG